MRANNLTCRIRFKSHRVRVSLTGGGVRGASRQWFVRRNDGHSRTHNESHRPAEDTTHSGTPVAPFTRADSGSRGSHRGADCGSNRTDGSTELYRTDTAINCPPELSPGGVDVKCCEWYFRVHGD